MTAAGEDVAKPGVVLVLDDDPDMAEFVAEVVETAGATARIVADGRELLSILRNERPRALILDIVMPDMDGIELVQAIGRIGVGTPILLISGSSRQYVSMAEILGAQRGAVIAGSLLKPFTVDELTSALRSIIRLYGSDTA